MANWSLLSIPPLCAIVLLGCGAAHTRQPSENSETKAVEPALSEVAPWRISKVKDPLLLTRPNGRRFEIVSIESTTDESLLGRYLVRVTNTHDKIDGVVVLAELTEKGYLRATIGAEPYYLLYFETVDGVVATTRSGWFYTAAESNYNKMNLAVGDHTEVDAEELLKRYERQETDGLNKRLAPRDRSTRERLQQAKVDAGLREDTFQSCGPVSMSVDWSTVEDDWFDDFSIANACGADLAYLFEFCVRFPNRIETVRSHLAMQCAFSGHPNDVDPTVPSLSKAGGFVVVPHQERFAGKELSFHYRKLFDEQEQVLRGKHVYFIARDEPGLKRQLYNGDGKTFYPAGRVSDNAGFNIKPLSGGTKTAALLRDEGDWFLECGSEREKLSFLEGKERDAILQAAVIESKPKWQRKPHFLARDSLGTYYYVDRVLEEFGGRGYRVFIGRRGGLRLSKLKGVVDDSVGTVFSTDKGDLRLVINDREPEAFWIKGKKKSELTVVNVHGNNALIYDELGAYFGEDLGFVCDK